MPTIPATSSIASGDTHPSCSWARCSNGRTAERANGYFATICFAFSLLAASNVTLSAPGFAGPTTLPLADRSQFGRRGMLGARSTMHLAQDRVDRGDDRARVGDQAVLHHRAHRREVVEGRPADVHARRLPGAVGHEVAADLTARGLDRRVGLARGDAEPLGEELEVVDQRLHRLVDASARRGRDLLVLHAI